MIVSFAIIPYGLSDLLLVQVVAHKLTQIRRREECAGNADCRHPKAAQTSKAMIEETMFNLLLILYILANPRGYRGTREVGKKKGKKTTLGRGPRAGSGRPGRSKIRVGSDSWAGANDPTRMLSISMLQ
jgi:hypothetical protein